MKIILFLSLILFSGCATNIAPNSWNLTIYQPTDGNKSGQTIAVGVSGALPFGKQ
jgi:hypothetical protein